MVHALLRAASVDFPSHINAAIGEADFFANLGVEVPARRHETGRDELRADVALAQRFFIHAASGRSRLKKARHLPAGQYLRAGEMRARHRGQVVDEVAWNDVAADGRGMHRKLFYHRFWDFKA